MHKYGARIQIKKLREAQIEIARAVGSQELLVALYLRPANEIAESFREDILGFSICDEKARLRVVIEELGEAVVRIADIEYDQDRRSDGWQDQSRSQMRDKAIRALEDGLRRALTYRNATRATEHEYDGAKTTEWLMVQSLRAGMIGDSLGARIEFSSLKEIEELFPKSVNRILPAYGVKAPITDDSQMTLFTLEGLLESQSEELDKKVAAVHRSLLRWLDTQGETGRLSGGDHGIKLEKMLQHKRAPGGTCLSALREAKEYGEPAANDSKGCGTIMRVTPVAFMAPRDQVRELALRTSALTHGHPTAQWAAAFWAELITEIQHCHSVCDITTDLVRSVAIDLIEEYEAIPEATEVVTAAKQALASNDVNPLAVEQLGGGWTAETALAIALRSCCVARHLEEGLKIAVTHSGDSDSTGAIAGNLLGIIFPGEVVSHRWHAEVEGMDLLDALVGPIR